MRRVSRAILVLLFISVQLLTFVAHQSRSNAEEASLTASNPTVASLGSVTSDQVLGSRPCANMTIDVVQSVLNHIVTNEQKLCMVNTLAGLMNNNGTIIQPNGSGKAYYIADHAGGRSVYVPIPNQDAVLRIVNASTYDGSNIYIYRNFYSHLHFDVFSQQFVLQDSPDVSFKYGDGHYIPFNTGVLSFSKNGQYMVTDVNYHGLVRINLNTYQITPFAADLPHMSGGGSLSATSTIDDAGRFVAIGYNAPLDWGDKFFKLVDVDGCSNSKLADNQYGKTTFNCPTANYISSIKQAAPDFSATAGISFVNEGVLLFDVFSNSGTNTRYSLAASGVKMNLVDYLAMGDSYISGEGAYAYRDGTDTSINKCHQSMVSYPYLIGQAKFESYASVACSGAVVDNIIGNDDQNNDFQVKEQPTPENENTAYNMYLPGVILQNKFLKLNPQVVTVSIGGNDVGFSDIIKRCIVPFDKLTSISQNCYQTYEDRRQLVDTINGQFDSLVSTYTQIKGQDPTRRVYVIGYPQVVSATGACGDNVRLSESDRLFAGQLISYLDSVIKKAADKAGVYYVDTQHAFDGHKLCESGSKAVNGLTAGKETFGILGQESYHPDALGHQLLANAIMSETHGLTAPMPTAMDVANPKPSDAVDLLSVPKENRAIYEVLSADDDIYDGISTLNGLGAPLIPATPTHFLIDSFNTILPPNTNFMAVLHSDPVDLGTFQTDPRGNLSGELTLPAGIPAGFHTLHFYGKNIMGDSVDVQRTVFAAYSSEDYDGDGIPNKEDTCVGVPNSGHDMDKDGTDDACDAVIGDAPVKISVATASSTSAQTNKAVPAAEFTGTIVAGLQPADNRMTQSPVESVQLSSQDVLGAATTHSHTSGQPSGKIKSISRSWFYGLAALALMLLIAVIGWRKNYSRS